MILERRRLEGRGLALAGLGMLAVAGMVIASLAGTQDGMEPTEIAASGEGRAERDLSHRVAAVDQALSRRDLSRAVHEWLEAHGEAVRSGRWEVMVTVATSGDGDSRH